MHFNSKNKHLHLLECRPNSSHILLKSQTKSYDQLHLWLECAMCLNWPNGRSMRDHLSDLLVSVNVFAYAKSVTELFVCNQNKYLKYTIPFFLLHCKIIKVRGIWGLFWHRFVANCGGYGLLVIWSQKVNTTERYKNVIAFCLMDCVNHSLCFEKRRHPHNFAHLGWYRFFLSHFKRSKIACMLSES